MLESDKNIGSRSFTDDFKINLFGYDDQRFVWRREGTILKSASIKATIKHSGEWVIVWGSMGASGVKKLVFIKGTMNKMMYLNILKENLTETASKFNLYRNYSMIQDNDSKHNARVVKEWLLYKVQ